MAAYRLVENEFLGSRHGGLFHSPAFFRLHAGDQGGRYFEWIDDSQVVASIHFTPMDDQLWRSPACGTFAGYAFDPRLHSEDLFAFHAAVEDRLSASGLNGLEILPPPMAHGTACFSRQTYMLRCHGFEISRCDLNYTLAVDQRSFHDRINHGNRKRLRTCQRDGFVAMRLPLDELESVYDTILANRVSRGYPISMSLENLQAMAGVFPEAMVLFGIRDGDKLAAAALCLRLSPSVLYVFYWGDRPGYNGYSPVVTLAEGVYTYCQAEGIAILDAGTSTEDCVPNHGLIQFKRGLGFTDSLKFRMRKTL